MYVKRAEFQHGIFRVCLTHSSTWAVFTNLYWFLQLTTVCILPTNSAKALRSNNVIQCNNNLTQTVQLLYWPVGWFQNRRTTVDVLPTSNIGAASWEFQTVSVITEAPVSIKNNKQSNINIPFTWHWNKHAKNTILIAFSALTLLVRHQEEHLVCKNWATRCWCGYLSGASEVQTVCIWSSWCHCHPETPSSLALFKSRLFWYWLTQVVLEKRQLNRRSVE